MKAFLIVFCILVVLGFGLLALFVFVIDAGVHVASHYATQLENQSKAEAKVEKETGISTNPIGFDAAHPPQLDVNEPPLKCSVDSSGLAVATGKVHNHTAHASSYLITVDFSAGGQDVGTGLAQVYHVGSGDTVTYRAAGSSTTAKSVSCKVSTVLRSDNPAILPTTTTG